MNTNVLTHTEKDKLKAAYALNLCTVSVSQIVDYKDLNILEQEYELILNNLNLHNMPKDQALLHVLKQILDTVTFFRIAEGDKALIEKKYQQKVKNAIWNAIPSFGLIAVGDPYTFAISMLASVGMGYMNYRKEKSQTNLEREEQEWQLQRTAIEQFYALRRELFDTAWRLADNYDFEDNYRLTESQISQYNNILMDSNPLRKYERLDSIKDNFMAYPPFWYYIANAAKDVADMYRSEPQCEETLCAISQYTIISENYYKKYLEVDIDLLRVNYTRSACDLEYAALLLEKHQPNQQKIIELVDDAVKHCGSMMDVFQHAAVYYLKVQEIEKAQAIFRKLVIEGYNTKTNSQLLSYIYLQESILDKKKYIDYTRKYKELIQFVDITCILPWIDSINDMQSEKLNEINNKFIENQKELLDHEFECIVNAIVAREAVAYNRQLYKLHYMDVCDSFFDDSIQAIKERREEFSRIYSNDKEWNRFVAELSRSQISVILNDQMNVLISKLAKLSFTAFRADIERVIDLDDIKDTLISKANGTSIVERITELEGKIINGNFTFKDYDSLSELTFSQIMRALIEDFKIQFEIESIGMKDTYKELAYIESAFIEYCQKEDLPSLEILCSLGQEKTNNKKERTYFDLLSCFKNGKGTKERRDIENRIIEILKNGEKEGVLFEKNQDGLLFTTDVTTIYQRLNELSNAQATEINRMGRPLAYFHDHKNWNERAVDIFFFSTGIYRMRSAKVAMTDLNFYLYSEICIDSVNKELYKEEGKKGSIKRISIYDSNQTKLDVLYNLIKESEKVANK